MSILLWYTIGFWIALSVLGRDGEGLDAVDVVVCFAYPLILGVFIPYHLASEWLHWAGHRHE